jgi:hypothetical protein
MQVGTPFSRQEEENEREEGAKMQKIYQTNNPKASIANNTARTNSSSLIRSAG